MLLGSLVVASVTSSFGLVSSGGMAASMLFWGGLALWAGGADYADLSCSEGVWTSGVMPSLLVVLSGLVLYFMVSGVNKMGLGPQKFMFYQTHLVLLLALFGFFSVNSLLAFFMLFESSAVLIFIMVVAWGYQPEREAAGLSLLVYTGISALPLLVVCMLLKGVWGVHDLTDVMGLGGGQGANGLVGLAASLGFMVKFPVYGFHLWLPRAHVEASAGGSMLLAGVLLKMGGYGLYIVSPLLPPVESASLVAWGVSSSAAVSLLCLRQSDMKLLIAYSSIAHMGLVVAALATKHQLGVSASLFIMLAHGVSASLSFFLAGELYNWSHSRQIYLNQSLLTAAPVLSAMWFFSAMANMGTPPTANFWGELLALFVLVPKSGILVGLLSASLFLGAGYTVLLYGGVNVGQASASQGTGFVLQMSFFTCAGAHVAFTLLLVLMFSLA